MGLMESWDFSVSNTKDIRLSWFMNEFINHHEGLIEGIVYL